ncbi:sulfite exporter TauE/SafE family protein [Sphaerisporangium sp. NPDC051017]|uniref:sulfite exporter TauE/SafE family protein n=1 Tax=Sphaerisporangium sp. NPDC051017 TaxID=3154636 RepID=UPI00341E8871
MTPLALLAGGLAAGLVAGGTSCAAVQGGVMIGLARPGGPRAAVPAFIAGRLVAHTALGALLGMLGEAVRIPPPARAALLVAAGAGVIVFALRLVRSRGPACASGAAPAEDGTPACAAPHPGRAEQPEVPGTTTGRTTRIKALADRWRITAVTGRWRRIKALTGRWRAMGPVALGGGTVLIPCGVTLSTELVAVSAGWLGGAAVMAGFVAGTSPAFALLGLVLRRIAATRLVTFAAVAAVAAGSLTVLAGLRLGGWLPDLGDPSKATAAGVRLAPDGTQVVTIWSTGHGFLPGVAGIEAGRPAEIVFRTRDNQGCTRTLTIQGRDIALPVTGERVVRLAPQEPGRLRYVCGMGMYVGFININQPTLPAHAAATPAPDLR